MGKCCGEMTAKCLACEAKMDVATYCKQNKGKDIDACPKPNCCKANNAKCLSCQASMDVATYCEKNKGKDIDGCPKPICRPPVCKAGKGCTYEKPVFKNGCKVSCGTKKCIPKCCGEMTAKCLACEAKMDVPTYCEKNKGKDIDGCPKPKCCKANNAKCLSCQAGMDVSTYCEENKGKDIDGCPKPITVPDDFDCKCYLKINTDVQKLHGDDCAKARQHYINNGAREARSYKCSDTELPKDFDCKCYLERYEDLQAAYGKD